MTVPICANLRQSEKRMSLFYLLPALEKKSEMVL